MLSRKQLQAQIKQRKMQGTYADRASLNSEEKDLPQLSQLGHFLKGSSATLGLTKVKDHCEKIQHLGAQKDEEGNEDEPDKEKCLSKIKDRVKLAKRDFYDVEKVLKRFYHDEGSS